MRKNVSVKEVVRFPRTHEGGVAAISTKEQDLRRSVMSCLLWEGTFYENGVEISQRISDLVKEVDYRVVRDIAVEARTRHGIRHASLLLACEMAGLPIPKEDRWIISKTISDVICRADELAEFLALYWRRGRRPLSKQVKKGLALAFRKFDEYELAKYDRDYPIRLRDVLLLCHPKPEDSRQSDLWKRLIERRLATPNTWEVRLSSGEDKKSVWESLLRGNKIGALALLRNLRNMLSVGVDRGLLWQSIARADVSGVFPFQIYSAWLNVPPEEFAIRLELERCFVRRMESSRIRFGGTTSILVDVSGSMEDQLSERGSVLRYQAAGSLAVILSHLCDRLYVFSFSNSSVQVEPEPGFSFVEKIWRSQENGGTYVQSALDKAKSLNPDRIIIITDGQIHDSLYPPGCRGYVINVAPYKHGIGYGNWIVIDGFSQAVIEYIHLYEEELSQPKPAN